MYRIEKRVTVPIGHRLSKNTDKCQNIHGHNFTILVGIKTENLDENDMIMDFSEIKKIIESYTNLLDHCLILNETDINLASFVQTTVCEKVLMYPYDPTAERLAEKIFCYIEERLHESGKQIFVDYVTIYENENSKATFDRSH
jgi:6-pyruvoyltetrahydropterin/6-carboxytetrahydropterin synthase